MTLSRLELLARVHFLLGELTPAQIATQLRRVATHTARRHPGGYGEACRMLKILPDGLTSILPPGSQN